MAANGVILLVLTAWVLQPIAFGTDLASPRGGSRQARPVVELPDLVPTKEQVLGLRGMRFGVSAPQVPWSAAELDRIATAAGTRPTLLQFFVKWNQDFRPEAVAAAYRQRALPVLSWEPWAGTREGDDQPAYALAKIINGEFDEYIAAFASAVRDQRWPVAIRFAHEMNGHWHPWAETRSGNRPGEYAVAWRHVHDVFRQVGADNVIWIWSPNILRPVPKVSLSALYPGDAYVDWVGMVGYAVTERGAGQVYDPTVVALRTFTQRPIVITETGVQPSNLKIGWIRDFFQWLATHPYVIGFIWFEYSREEGGSADWRFTASDESATAFRNGLRGLTLAPPPIETAPPSPPAPAPPLRGVN
jgi:hypothetical protein